MMRTLYIVIIRIFNRIKNVYRKKHSTFIWKISDTAEWVYISYLTDIFYYPNDNRLLSSHQNRREALIIAKVFNQLGFNIYIQDHVSKTKIPKIKFSIVFGLEPNFCNACIANPQSIKIYYATGAYYEHQNKQIQKMTDYVNVTYDTHIPYQRLVTPHKSIELADYILQIGSSYTILTYPPSFQSKIELIHQSSQSKDCYLKKKYACDNEYFCMASGGNILKGISLLIEYFYNHPERTINIVGPIDKVFYRSMKRKISPNIKLWGFMDINSDELTAIIDRCNFLIYPSGSEGCPGAVINSMKKGLIPIVTPWAAFDGIEEYGFLMDAWSIDAISMGVAWSLTLDPVKIEEMSCKCQLYIEHNYGIKQFENEFFQYIRKIISVR